jgi:predicted ATPase
MELKVNSLSIHNFRALRRLRIEGLGRVNLITGRNNTGKSSVLEALRILASDASPYVIYSILRSREEDTGDIEESTRTLDVDGIFQWSSIFHGFPPFSPSLAPIEMSSKGLRQMKLTIEAGFFTEERDPDGSRRLLPQQNDLFGEGESVPALVTDFGTGKRIMSLDSLRRSRFRRLRAEFSDDQRMPCVFVSPYGGERTSTLGPLWDKIALSDRENDIVEALRIIDPGISAISMIGGEEPRQTRTAIVRSRSLSRPVPLRSFGDGLNRLFSIILSLVNAKDGILLIDEFENGMHHTVQADAWRIIFNLAQRLDIQVVATSHSWDSIEAFQKAASEAPADGVLIRLSRRHEDILATLFLENELAVATREHIEVR